MDGIIIAIISGSFAFITFLLTRYSASISHSRIDNYDDYNLKYNSVSITVDDSATFASLGFTCDQTLSEGKSYNVQ